LPGIDEYGPRRLGRVTWFQLPALPERMCPEARPMLAVGVVCMGVASELRPAGGLLKSRLRSVPLNEWRLLGLATLFPRRDCEGKTK
jgi:hypothetical protein